MYAIRNQIKYHCGGLIGLRTLIGGHGKGFHSYVNEPGHPIPGKKPRMTTAEDAVSVIKSGDNVYLHAMAATPKTAITALSKHGAERQLRSVQLHHLIIEGDAEYTRPEFKDIFRGNSLFAGLPCRESINAGRGDFTPIFLQDVPKLFNRKLIPLDVVIVHVTPKDKHGYHSLGTSVDASRAAVVNGAYIIGQVNPRMPRTQGDALVHESHFDVLFEAEEELSELVSKPLSEADKAIGKYIAENLVEDGATLQMGIGGIPDAVLSQLGGHKNLGVHSEMFSDGVVDLVHKGCITNALKNVERGRIAATFVIGTRKLFDFIDDNPMVTMRTCDWINREAIVSQNPRVTAINSCIELDIVGNIVSDSIGSKVFSGFGGQVDFLRGAAMGFDGLGKPILALQSMTNKGQSKIVPSLRAGANVTATRGHVHYVVTEFGIAYLFGKNYRQRAHALISIAHPDHREALERGAFERLGCMPSP